MRNNEVKKVNQDELFNPKDITGSEFVQIVVRQDRKTIWINTQEGGCILRICRIKKLEIIDLSLTNCGGEET